jgi:hypothetical protein
LHEQPNALSSVVHEYMHNVVFKVQVFEVETSFEQVFKFLHILQKNCVEIVFLFAHLKLINLGIMYVNASSMGNVMPIEQEQF